MSDGAIKARKNFIKGLPSNSSQRETEEAKLLEEEQKRREEKAKSELRGFILKVCQKQFDRIVDERDVDSLNERTENFRKFFQDKQIIAQNYQELERVLDEEEIDDNEVARLAGYTLTTLDLKVDKNAV